MKECWSCCHMHCHISSHSLARVHSAHFSATTSTVSCLSQAVKGNISLWHADFLFTYVTFILEYRRSIPIRILWTLLRFFHYHSLLIVVWIMQWGWLQASFKSVATCSCLHHEIAIIMYNKISTIFLSYFYFWESGRHCWFLMGLCTGTVVFSGDFAS